MMTTWKKEGDWIRSIHLRMFTNWHKHLPPNFHVSMPPLSNPFPLSLVLKASERWVQEESHRIRWRSDSPRSSG